MVTPAAMPFVTTLALPLAVALSMLLVRRAGIAWLPASAPHQRLLAGLTTQIAWTIVGVRVLAGFGVLGAPSMLLWLAVGAALAHMLARRAQRAPTWPEPAGWSPILPQSASEPRSAEPWWLPSTVPVLLVFTGAVLLWLGAVLWLPVWQWDGLGYHLPLVNYLLERGRADDVPPDVPFLSTYPRNVEYFFTALRALLPDDTLVDAGQLPFVVLAVVAVANLTVTFGGRLAHGVAAGFVFCMLPAAFLIVPTNYIDFACAALLLMAMAWSLMPPSPRHLALAAIGLGLFLGAKSNGPIGTALVGVVALGRALRAAPRGQRLWPVLGFTSCVLVLGSEMYLVNTIRHHNPLWPIDIHAGPWHLPGTVSVEKLLAAGARAPRVHGPLPLRVLKSWTALRARPLFDMRYGGLGLVFDFALVLALITAWRQRSRPAVWMALIAFALAAVASPDPAWPRYVLAVPGLALALASVWFRTQRFERLAWWGVAALSLANLLYAAPGLVGDGPPLSAYPRMSRDERARAVWAESPVDGWFAARDALKPGENAAYDFSMELPYLLWKPDIGNRVFRLPDHATPSEVAELLRAGNVRLLVAGDDEPAGALVREQPQRFQFLFRCPLRQCAVYRL